VGLPDAIVTLSARAYSGEEFTPVANVPVYGLHFGWSYTVRPRIETTYMVSDRLSGWSSDPVTVEVRPLVRLRRVPGEAGTFTVRAASQPA